MNQHHAPCTCTHPAAHNLLILQSSQFNVLYTPVWRVGGVLHEPVSRQRRWLESGCQLMTPAS